MINKIPIILFAYARPDHLRRTLSGLRENQVPLIYAFSDAPRTSDKAAAVAKVRQMLRAIDWCKVELCEREENLGLGRSILSGVTAVLSKHDMAIIFEDDLVCVPGTYNYLCAALEHYQNDHRVMSVTGWTHPMVTPSNVTNQPYFDGRAECWVWGTWKRTWEGMETNAKTLMEKCNAEGLDIYRYGADLVEMAKVEQIQNIWAVRLLYWHILNRSLCLRPPWSMVEHIGFDLEATNTKTELWTKSPPLNPSPPIPLKWPEPVENPECSHLHQKACGTRPTFSSRLYNFTHRAVSKILRTISLK